MDDTCSSIAARLDREYTFYVGQPPISCSRLVSEEFPSLWFTSAYRHNVESNITEPSHQATGEGIKKSVQSKTKDKPQSIGFTGNGPDALETAKYHQKTVAAGGGTGMVFTHQSIWESVVVGAKFDAPPGPWDQFHRTEVHCFTVNSAKALIDIGVAGPYGPAIQSHDLVDHDAASARGLMATTKNVVWSRVEKGMFRPASSEKKTVRGTGVRSGRIREIKSGEGKSARKNGLAPDVMEAPRRQTRK